MGKAKTLTWKVIGGFFVVLLVFCVVGGFFFVRAVARGGATAIPPATVSSASADALDIAGTWKGSYRCGQGLAGVTLVLTPIRDGRFTGTFTFYALPANPGIPSGQAAMKGTRSAHGIMLTGDYWIKQPPGYIIAGMEADIATNGPKHIEGQMIGPNCSRFSIDKASDIWSSPPV
jgi:hypothetical protein